uniref:Uncharacterized protein n=1 Tax=Zea mays TaxID=4577 RepID=C0PEF0_MAIZE|nr:unknown [Zea mays]
MGDSVVRSVFSASSRLLLSSWFLQGR